MANVVAVYPAFESVRWSFRTFSWHYKTSKYYSCHFPQMLLVNEPAELCQKKLLGYRESILLLSTIILKRWKRLSKIEDFFFDIQGVFFRQSYRPRRFHGFVDQWQRAPFFVTRKSLLQSLSLSQRECHMTNFIASSFFAKISDQKAKFFKRF